MKVVSSFIPAPLTSGQIAALPTGTGRYPNGAVVFDTTLGMLRTNVGTDAAPAWRSEQPVIATSLPASPADGQEYILVDSTSAPTYSWHLKYSSAASKWLWVGGADAFVAVDTVEGCTSVTYVALATAGPSFTVPRAGDYLLEFGARVIPNVSGGGSDQGYMAFDLGASAATDNDAAVGTYSVSTVGIISTLLMQRKKTGLAASTAIVSKYRVSSAANNGKFMLRYLKVRPISVT
jgi:hypothetical protein